MTKLIDRRTFLRVAASSAGAAASLGLLPASIRRALAIPANNATGTIEDVEHVVVLMQENRSFDHYFGTLAGVRGFGDPRPVILPGGKTVFHQPNGTGELLPFRPDVSELGLTFIQDLDHTWPTTHQAWNQGMYNQWVAAKGTTTMAYMTRVDIPYHYALADAFTICDAYHCSLLGPTDPNRYYMWTGWVGNDGSGGGPVIDNAEAGYSWSTYPEILQKSGVSWKVYQDIGTGLNAAGEWGYTSAPFIGNFGDNSLLYFNQYRTAVAGDPLFDNARTGTDTAVSGTLFDGLSGDVAAGTLPRVSWVVAPQGYSEHPNFPPNYGALYVSRVLDILTSNADLWSKTVLLVMYDENDGLFDHVPPPTVPPSSAQGMSTVATTNELFAGNATNVAGPYGLGPRVPMIVVSPWSKGGWVCSELFDHTSIIQFIEQVFGARAPGIVSPNISPWRRAVCGDLRSALDFATPDAGAPVLPSTAAFVPPDMLNHPDYDPAPPSSQSLPKQEAGLRPARALPYELFAQGRLDAPAGAFWIDFANTGTAGAVFRVGATDGSAGPWTYTVEAGKTLSASWATVGVAAGAYDFTVHGPNGFLRRYAGNLNTAASAGNANPEAGNCYDVANANVQLTLSNQGSVPCQLSVANAYATGAPHVYTLAAGAQVTDYWDVRASHGWYDLSVSSASDAQFARRFAGHVENGQASMSDPAIVTV